MKKLAVLLISVISLNSCDEQKSKMFVPADSPEIRYVGRTLTGEDGSVSFDWSGTYLTISFTGPDCSIVVSDTKKNYYNVYIDGWFSHVIKTEGPRQTILLAEGLRGKNHNIRLQKRTEGEQGRTTVYGFELAAGSTLTALGNVPVRHIEFIGDSLTCGFGTEGGNKDEPFTPETENCDHAFACIISRYFWADYTLIAHSGQGAVRNWDDKVQESEWTMKDRMMCTFDEDRDLKWDYSKSTYKPNLVVISLGTNDFSTAPQPTCEQFTGAYRRIIGQVREGYGDVPVLCVAPRGETYSQDCLRDLVLNGGIGNIYYAAWHPNITDWDSDLGPAYHPKYKGQCKMAAALIPYISTITGWEMGNRVIE